MKEWDLKKCSYRTTAVSTSWRNWGIDHLVTLFAIPTLYHDTSFLIHYVPQTFHIYAALSYFRALYKYFSLLQTFFFPLLTWLVAWIIDFKKKKKPYPQRVLAWKSYFSHKCSSNRVFGIIFWNKFCFLNQFK